MPAARFQLLGNPDPGNPTSVSEQELQSWLAEGIVEHLGEHRDVRPYIRAASIVVLPTYREGMSRALLEGAAMGKPLIGTDVAGSRELIDDGVTGLLCQARDPGNHWPTQWKEWDGSQMTSSKRWEEQGALKSNANSAKGPWFARISKPFRTPSQGDASRPSRDRRARARWCRDASLSTGDADLFEFRARGDLSRPARLVQREARGGRRSRLAFGDDVADLVSDSGPRPRSSDTAATSRRRFSPGCTSRTC